jgi:hypothetical protein
MGIPEELLTIEFFSDVQAVSIRVAANIIMDSTPTLPATFSLPFAMSSDVCRLRIWIQMVIRTPAM